MRCFDPESSPVPPGERPSLLGVLAAAVRDADAEHEARLLELLSAVVVRVARARGLRGSTVARSSPERSEATLDRALESGLDLRTFETEWIGEAYEGLMDGRVDQGGGRRSGDARRRSGSHYTPRALAESIVRRTLEPLLVARSAGDGPSSRALLGLRVCDPAMGCGALLLAACRHLGDELRAAWEREGTVSEVEARFGSAATHARRLVARQCLYGVDSNPVAVSLARLSLWLEVGAPDEPATLVDDGLRCGDALVGLPWRSAPGFDPLGAAIEHAHSRRGHADHREAVQRARLVGDVLVGAFFEHATPRERRAEVRRRREVLAAWLRRGPGAEVPTRVQRWAARIRTRLRPLHWPLELPGLFEGSAGRAFVGNPPFMGKNAITASAGPGYVEWLQSLHPGAHGNADLSAHFFRRAASLTGEHGTIGLLATNTIAQGDTRTTGLRALVRQGWEIYDATPSVPWPGEAAVSVAVVHLARGSAVGRCPARLSGRPVSVIDSRLRPQPERASPVPLRANAGKGFVGTYVLGMGFTLTPAQRDELVRRDPRNAERIKPYLGGAELNRSPTQAFSRYVIDFGDLSLAQARRWPQLLERVEREVKPSRDRNNRAAYRERWWQFGEKRPALYEAIAPLRRCLVAARVSKHLCLSFQPVDRVFSEQLDVFAIDDAAAFALLQSRVHERWARRLSSSLEDRLRYSVSGCFETFPFPEDLTPLRELGEQLHRERAQFMRATEQGLTKTYNALVDRACREPEVEALRQLHERIDRAVLRAYGWSDLEVPPLTEAVDGVFEDAVVDRLYALNARRAGEEG